MDPPAAVQPNGGDGQQAPNGAAAVSPTEQPPNANGQLPDERPPNGDLPAEENPGRDVTVQVDFGAQIQANFLNHVLSAGTLRFLRAVNPSAANTMEALRNTTDEWRWWGAMVNPDRPRIDPSVRSPLHAFAVETILSVLETYEGESFSPALVDAVEMRAEVQIGLTPPDLTNAREHKAKILMSLHEQACWFGHHKIPLREFQSNRSRGYVAPAHKALLDQPLENTIALIGWTHNDVVRRNALAHVNERQLRINAWGGVITNADPTIRLFDRLEQVMERITTKRWLVFATDWTLDYGVPRHASRIQECEHPTYADHVRDRVHTFDKKTAIYEAVRLREYHSNGLPIDQELKVGGEWFHWVPFGHQHLVVGGSEEIDGFEVLHLGELPDAEELLQAVVEMQLTPSEDEHLFVKVAYRPESHLSTHELMVHARTHALSLDVDERQHWLALFLSWFEYACLKLIS